MKMKYSLIKRKLFFITMTILLYGFSTQEVSASQYPVDLKQSSLNEKIVTLDETLKVEALLKYLDKISEYSFFYDSKIDELKNNITIKVKDATIINVLDKICKTTNLEYKVAKKEVVIRKKTTNDQNTTPVNVSGTVKDRNSETLPGVSVHIENTTNGTTTDIDGNFSIDVAQGQTLVFSYMGYSTQKIVFSGQTSFNIVLLENSSELEEVVLVGYTTVKKKLATGANLNVKGDAIEELTPNSAMDALQGISPGVNITQSSGQPGKSAKVFIRGVGTTGDSSPLYVVDGVYVGNIDYLNPSDIESIDVLKDAASAAIYGSRAANGVILVTTKKGKKNTVPIVTFDSYYGIQNIFKSPSTLNTQEYAYIMNEGRVNDGLAPWDYSSLIPNWSDIENGDKGTDWVDQMTKSNAPISNASVNVTGGSDRVLYSFGASHYEQTGIIGGDVINSGFKRTTIRLNTDFVVAKRDEGSKNLITIGENITYNNSDNKGIADGNIYWNDMHNALVQNPFMPVKTNGEYTKTFDSWDQGQVNPIALMDYERNNNWNKSNSIVGNIYIIVEPIDNLKIRSAYGINAWFGNNRNWVPAYNLGILNNRPNDIVGQSMNQGSNWTWTNTVSYDFNIDKHNISALAGIEMNKSQLSLNLSGENQDSNFNSADKAYLINVPLQDITQVKLTGMDWAAQGGGLLSYFGSITYNYNEKYMLTGVLRADGSSNFYEDNRWGVFPSLSAGWVVSNEDFLSGYESINHLKLRASWGQNGNQSIPNFGYTANISYGGSYFFGADKQSISNGAYPANVPNLNTTWETSEQINIGLDANLLRSRLKFTFDWYVKDTKDWLVEAPILASAGAPSAHINGGSVRNKGVEISLGWQDTYDDFNWGATASFAYNNNEITEIANEEKIIHGPANVLSQGTSEVVRAEVGHAIGYFWGFETNGILQNQKDVNEYVAPTNSVTTANGTAGKPYFNDQRAGDVRFIDQNQDGIINDLDKVDMGDPLPKFIFGLQVNAEYKGIYANATLTGQAGMQVMQSYRSFADKPKQNYTTEIFERWHGEGTSNKLPRLSSSPNRNTNYVSDIYMHDASFLRISNITIGYSFKELLKNQSFISDLRIYGSAKNLYTFTSYNGMDPEVGYGPTAWSSGIDLGLYPSARTYLIGLKATF